jgi:uncharacterized membrane protein
MKRRDLAPFILGAAFVALFVVRAGWSGRLTYFFLFWNLFLATVPWALAHAARVADARNKRWLAWALLVPWLLFLPNAPYVLTDFVHLHERPPVALWYDAALLATASLTGLAFAVVSLRIAHDFVRARAGELAGWSTVAVACGASGFGIWLGRFERLNSWDVVADPAAVIHDTLAVAIHPVSNTRAVVVTTVFALLFGAAYLASMRKPSASFALRATPPALCMAGIWLLSSISLGSVPAMGLPLYDKIVHSIAYGFLAFLIARAIVRITSPRAAAIAALVIVVAWGGLDEIHQAHVPGRSADALDFIADTIGALIGLIVHLRLSAAGAHNTERRPPPPTR